MHRIPRILLAVAVAGVLAMHGVDATTTVQHVAATPHAAAQHDIHASGPMSSAAADPTSEDQTDGAGHHVVVLCIAALVGALGFAGRRLLVRLAGVAAKRTELAVLTAGERVDEILRPPPPAWVRLCVLRR